METSFAEIDMSDTPEHKVGSAIQGVFGALDELIVLAAATETRGCVIAERVALNQLLARCQLLASIAEVTRPTVIKGGKS